MAFIAGGIGGIYTLEHLPLPFAALIHAGVLYADYLILYLFNNWISRSPEALGVFTGIFVLGFALVWLLIYLCSRRSIRQLNKKIKGGQ